MRRHLILLGLLVLAAVTLMAGCSADEIMSAGQTMGSLGSAGLGKAGEKVVSETAKEVEQFIASYESCLKPRTMFTASVGGVEKISFPLLDGALSDTSFFFKSIINRIALAVVTSYIAYFIPLQSKCIF